MLAGMKVAEKAAKLADVTADWKVVTKALH